MRMLRSAAVLLALSSLPGVASASAQVAQAGARPGWIGVSFDVLTTGDERGPRSEATITEVSEGSPAQRAGLHVGDHLISVNGMPARANLARLAQTLRPGDKVRVVVERDGRRIEMLIRAAPRPSNVNPTQPTVTWAVSTDSVVDALFQAMDSLRARLAASGAAGAVHVVTLPGQDDSIVAVLDGPGARRLLVRTAAGGVGGDSATALPIQGFFLSEVSDAGAELFPEIHPPFDFYVFRAVTPDSIRQAMSDLSRKMQETRALEEARLSTLADRSDPSRASQDDELLRLRRAMAQYEQRSNDLRSAMRTAAQQARTQVSAARDSANAGYASGGTQFRPLEPYRLGQNWVAGAQMVDLKPELGTYFNVHAGVLVVEVPQGTPAAAAGLQPGDVIVRAGNTDVHSIRDLRAGLNEPGDTLALRLIRKGQAVRAVLGR